MSNETQEPMEMGTKPVEQHDWLKNLLGDWRVESEMTMPTGETCTGTGRETVTSLGGLWAISRGTATMPDGSPMEYHSALGYDVSFNEYRGCWYASVSSHLWKQVGVLSPDGKTMTLTCEGPHMEKDGETALYRDVIEIHDTDHRTMTSYGQDDAGEWHAFMKARYTRL